jgi:hypothetical protein
MKISKSEVFGMGAPYSICYGIIDCKKIIAAGSETMGGEFSIYVGDKWSSVPVVENLGGIMAIVLSEMSGVPTIITAEGLHPNFISKDAGVSLYRAENGVTRSWVRYRIADFPYIHRIALVTASGVSTVIAATLCGEKKNRDDWSNLGAVFAVAIENSRPPFKVQTSCIFDGIKKNHGMFVKKCNGRETVFVSGEEGLFAIHVPKERDEWVIKRIIDAPISEFAIYDLDGDGEDEIVAIQPFHGNNVCIFKKKTDMWSRVFETETELGHGIWAGKIGGKDGFILGSRAGKRDFCIYTREDNDTWQMKKHIIEKGTGTAQLDVIHEIDHDLIVSTNNYTDEIALYRVTW